MSQGAVSLFKLQQDSSHIQTLSATQKRPKYIKNRLLVIILTLVLIADKKRGKEVINFMDDHCLSD